MSETSHRQQPAEAWWRLTLAVWAVLAVAFCLKTVALDGGHTVYAQFIGSSRHWWADQSLYADYTVTEHMDGYRYAPAFAVAFTPFYLLPNRVGLIAWNLLSMAVLFWATRALVRDVLATPEWKASEGAFLTLTLIGSAVGIWSAQSNALLVAMILLGLAAIVRERWWAAAFFLAVPVFLKIWPIAIVMLLAVCWPRRIVGRFAVACLVLALLPFLAKPPGVVLWQYQEWYLALTGPFQGRWGGYRDAWTVWEQVGPWLHCPVDWFDPVQHRVYTILQLATAAAVLGWCLLQRRRLLGEQAGVPSCAGPLLMRIFAIWAAWQLLFGPATEQLTYGIIAPATSWAILTCRFEHRANWPAVTAFVMLALLPAGDVERSLSKLSPHAAMLLPLGVVLFAAWLVHHDRDTASPASSHEQIS